MDPLAVVLQLLALLPPISGACDHLSLHFYNELGCSPVYTADPVCPSRFDCGALEMNRRNFCVVKNRTEDKGGRVDVGFGISNPCVPGCYCTQHHDQTLTRYRWECTHVDCAQYFRPSLQPGCYWQDELKSCCPWRKVCKKNLHKCVYNGVTYRENDRFYTFKESACMKCHCGPLFNGTLSEPWCREIGCDLELHDGEQLAKGCAPIYSKTFCCPIDWRCPDPEDTVASGGSAAAGGAQCRFGNLLLNIGDSVLPDLEASCQCNIPPYVVCTSS